MLLKTQERLKNEELLKGPKCPCRNDIELTRELLEQIKSETFRV